MRWRLWRRLRWMRVMSMPIPPMGLGIAWRPEIARFIETRADLGFVEVIAENVTAPAGVPRAVTELRERGVRVIPHGISLSLGGAEPIDRRRVRRLAGLGRALDAPLVSEHIAFVRGGGVEAGHLLPVPRTRAQLRVLVENVRAAQTLLPVPLALENIAALFDWPDAEMDETDFLNEILEQTGAMLLLDLANVHANSKNLGGREAKLGDLPVERIAYVHVAGGEERAGVYYDTHAHRTPPEVLELVEVLSARRETPGFMLERDDHFPSDHELGEELDAIAGAVARGRERRFAGVR